MAYKASKLPIKSQRKAHLSPEELREVKKQTTRKRRHTMKNLDASYEDSKKQDGYAD